jgi:rod shape-determining protein MreC
MSLRPGSRLPRGQWIVFGLLLSLSVAMMGASRTRLAGTLQTNANLILNPIEVAIDDGLDTLGSYWNTLTQLDSVRQENERLREENEVLRDQLARMPAIGRLNEDWTKISEAQQTSQFQTVIARVVMRDITDVRTKTIIVNRGSADGVLRGQVVIDAGGALVGRVSKVEAYNAVIVLVTDSSAVVVGEEAKSGATGTIRGQIGGLLEMSYVDSTDTLTKGEAVVTSGMVLPEGNVRSPYPPGLLIGTIISVTNDPNQVIQSALLRPAADLENANFVLVVMSYEGGFYSPPPSPSPSPTPTPSETPTPRPTPTAKPGPTPSPTQGLSTPPPY